MGAKRRYSEADRAVALALLDANGGNLKRTAREFGVPVDTLRYWRDRRVEGAEREEEPPAPKQTTNKDVQVAKESLADATARLAQRLVSAMEDKLADANLKDAAVAFGIAVDKMQVLRGEATSINEQRYSGRLSEFHQRYASGRAGDDAGGKPVHPPSANGSAN